MLRNKKTLLAIATLAMMAVLAVGTFAWTSFNNDVINQWRGDDTVDETPGGSVHDDFCGGVNKDVYVENWGDIPIYVRIQLSEYMEIGKKAGLTDSEAVSLINGALLFDRSTWETHIPHGSPGYCEAGFHDYWQWSMGGSKWYLPTANVNKHDSYIDQTSPKSAYGMQNLDGAPARQTPYAIVLLMDDWKAMGQPVGPYWVADSDGWFYWADAVAPGEATGLLLDAVRKVKAINDSWYYAINVKAQMASKEGTSEDGSPDNYNSFGDPANGGWTPDGKALMDIVTGTSTASKFSVTRPAVLINGVVYAPPGSSFEARMNGDSKDAIWILGSTTAFSMTVVDGVAHIGVTDGSDGNTASLSASSARLGDSGELTLIVLPAGAKGVVIGGDGQIYADYGDNTFSPISSGGQAGSMICGGMDRIPGTSDDRNDIAYLGNVKALGPESDGEYLLAGPDGLLGTEDDYRTVTGSDGVRYVNVGDNIFYPIDSDGNTGALIDGGADKIPGTSDDSPWTVEGPDGLPHPVVVGEDGGFYADLGGNVYATVFPPSKGIGDLLSGGIDLTPGTKDDRYNVIWHDGDYYIGPNPDGTYYAKGSDGLLGTADDVIVDLGLNPTTPPSTEAPTTPPATQAPTDEPAATATPSATPTDPTATPTAPTATPAAPTPTSSPAPSNPGLSELTNVNVGGTAQIDGFQWVVLKKTTDATGSYALLLKKDFDSVLRFSADDSSSDYEGSAVQYYLSSRYAAPFPFERIRANAVIPVLGDHSSKEAVSSPTSVLASSQPNLYKDIFFALSYKDADETRNYIAMDNNQVYRWWLRTSDHSRQNADQYNYVYYILDTTTNTPAINSENIAAMENSVGVRPAVWVKYTAS
jgi:hypothetical protein